MKPLYTKEQFESAKSRDLLPLECYYCGNPFLRGKNDLLTMERAKGFCGTWARAGKYCSQSCNSKASHLLRGNRLKVSTVCSLCGEKLERCWSQYARSKNHFCSRSCSVTYRNTHKTVGVRRSKLEVWLEEQLTLLYPDLEIHFNRKDAINSELDIYFPTLKLAFELNGPLHFEAVYGPEKLAQIQNNDDRKFQACAERGISLCLIDVSAMKHFKPARGEWVLSEIKSKVEVWCRRPDSNRHARGTSS